MTQEVTIKKSEPTKQASFVRAVLASSLAAHNLGDKELAHYWAEQLEEAAKQFRKLVA